MANTPPRGQPPVPQEPQSQRERMFNAVQQIVQKAVDDKKATREDAAAEKKRQGSKKRKRYWQVAALVLVLAGAIAWAIPRWKTPYAEPTGLKAERDARQAIALAAHLIHQHQNTVGHPPLTLADLGVALPGIEYMRADSSWTLTVRVDGRAITFTRGDDLAAFSRR